MQCFVDTGWTPRNPAYTQTALWWFVLCRYAKGEAADQCAVYSTDKDANGKEIGPQAESYWCVAETPQPWMAQEIEGQGRLHNFSCIVLQDQLVHKQ